MEIAIRLAETFCGYDSENLATSNSGSSAVDNLPVRVRFPPEFTLCQALVDDTYAWVSTAKVVAFSEKLRENNSLAKV